MGKKMQIMYWTIEINLLFWIAALVCVVGDDVLGYIRTTVVMGAVSAAILQLWAYYDLNKEYQRR